MFGFSRREAVRQRKALSRTSSNILLNSVHMGHTQSTNLNYLHPSDCELSATIAREETHSAISNLEVKTLTVLHNAPIEMKC